MQEDKRPKEQAEKMVIKYLEGSESTGAPLTKFQAIEQSLSIAGGLALSEDDPNLKQFWEDVEKELELLKTNIKS